jgi:hypothetical protein
MYQYRLQIKWDLKKCIHFNELVTFLFDFGRKYASSMAILLGRARRIWEDGQGCDLGMSEICHSGNET